jgi:hypothetical protein
LTSEIPWDTNVQMVLSHFGVTSNDYPNILSADPLATGSLSNPSQDPNRFVYLNTFPFSPPLVSMDQASVQNFAITQKTSNTSTSTSSESYSTGVSVSAGADITELFTAKLTEEETMTWKNSSSLKLSNGTNTADTLAVGQPLFGYNGPILLRAYEDTIFKTYAFSLDPVCGGSGVTAQLCNAPSGGQQCVWTHWGFEPGEEWAWGNSAETSSSIVSGVSHTGTQSLRISASSDPTLPASVNSEPCFGSADGTMDLRGKTVSAWVMVANSSSSYAGTACRLRAFNHSFQESALSAQAVSTPIKPGTWFQLSGVFPSTALESQIYELTVDCNLPGDWMFADSTKVWYVDDVQVVN